MAPTGRSSDGASADDPNDHSVVAVLADSSGDVVVGTGSLGIADALTSPTSPGALGARPQGDLGHLLDPAHAGKG